MARLNHDKRRDRDRGNEGAQTDFERRLAANSAQREAMYGKPRLRWRSETTLPHYRPEVFDKGVDALKSRRLRASNG